MSTLSQFAPFAGGGVKSIQTGYFFSTLSAGSGEDAKFVDVTISSVSTAKSIPNFYGTGVNGGLQEAYYSYDGAGSGVIQSFVLPRLTSSTNLRCSTNYNGQFRMSGRWYVVESN